MWLFTYNHTCFGYIQITTLNNKNTFGAPYLDVAKKYVETYSSSNAAAQDSKERVQLINIHIIR